MKLAYSRFVGAAGDAQAYERAWISRRAWASEQAGQRAGGRGSASRRDYGVVKVISATFCEMREFGSSSSPPHAFARIVILVPVEGM